jgi:hypothetical protein
MSPLDATSPSADCFLCTPDASLVYTGNDSAFALCGLGPIVSGYSVVGARAHVRSCADAAVATPELIALTKWVRQNLAERYQSCLLTEHGRLPVCVKPTVADRHCLHAHFLLFPGVPDIAEEARGYFAEVQVTPTLEQALAIARAHEEYFLLSPRTDSFYVMTRPGRLIRQFARLLVAEAVGQPERANWARYPDRERAEATAAELRGIMPATQTPWNKPK